MEHYTTDDYHLSTRFSALITGLFLTMNNDFFVASYYLLYGQLVY